MKMTEEVKTKKSKTKKPPAAERKKTKPKALALQDNQVLFSRPSTSNAPTSEGKSQGKETFAQEDSAPSGMEHDPTRLYLHELGYKPLLTPEDELSVARRIRQGDQAARTKMIESNLRLVVKIARHYCYRGLDLLD